MADRTIEVKVTESGLSEVKKKAEAVNNELNKIEQPRVVKSATRTGSRAADAALSVSDAGLQRGTTGAGGRGGERDFARQAQGLGGLVHLYATFAANIYAVGAAFSALQKAADFERMEKSAARMSVVLGMNLNAAARSMTVLTDGAMSYAESLEKVNLAGAAGLSSKQITELTKVAKGASAALGRDMGDSMNRLFKGTIKLEPELLDELGILTKASEAYKIYAAQIGKTEDELTKFEKTQAFVNAVITEGNSKYATLYDTVEANPYTKLQASIQDLGKNSLSVLNVALKPIVSFLAESPTGLAAAIGLVVSTLAKMAMPELLASMNTRLAKSREVFDAAAISFKKANEEVFKSFENTVGFATISGNTRSKLLKEATKIRKELNDSILTDFELSGTGPVSYSDKTNKLFADYEKSLTSYKGRLAGAAPTEKNVKALADVEKELSLIQSAKQNYAELADNEQIAASARKKENVATLDLMKHQRSVKVTELLLEGEYIAALKASYLAEVQITQELLKQKGLKETGFTALAGSARVAGAVIKTALTIAANFALKGMAWVGAISAIVSMAASILGEAKSIGELNQSIDDSSSGHKLLSERVSEASKLFFIGSANIDSYAKGMQLLGTTLGETSTNIDKTYDSYRKVKAEIDSGTATWTKMSEAVKSIWGGDVETKAAKAQTDAIRDAVTLAEKLGKADLLKSNIASALNVDASSISNLEVLNQKMKELNNSGDYLAKEKIKRSIEAISREAMNSASRVSELSSALAEANKSAETIDTKAAFKNPKYEALYDFIQKTTKLAETNKEEASRLFSQMFADMSPALIKELIKADSSLAEFFNSEYFTTNKMMKLFDATEAQKNLISGVAAMRSALDEFFKNPISIKFVANYQDDGEGGVFKADPGQVKRTKAKLTEYSKRTFATPEEIQTAVNSLSDSAKLTSEQNKALVNALTLRQQEARNYTNLAIETFARLENPTGFNEEQLAKLEADASDYMKKSEAAVTDLQKYGLAGGELTDAQKLLKGITEARGSAKDPAISFPKDRLKAEKASLETDRHKVALLEQQKTLNEANLRIADEFLGLGGEQYQQLLLTNFNTNVAIDQQKYLNQLKEAELKRDEGILGIQNDKNAVDRAGNIEKVNKEYDRQVELIKAQYEITKDTKRVEFERLAIIAAIRDQQVATSKAMAAAAKRDMSRTFSYFSEAASSAEDEVKFTKQQLSAQMLVVKQERKLATQRNASVDEISKYNDELAKQYALTIKLYEAQKIATEESLKAFELSGKGDIISYLINGAKEFGYQIKDALKAAPSAMSVLASGVIKGVDATIDKLFEGIQQGTLNMNDLITFARNELSNAFRDAASQVVKSGWKQLMSNLIPGLNDPLKTTIETNLIPSLEKLTNAILTKSTETTPFTSKLPGLSDNTIMVEGRSEATNWNTTGSSAADSALDKTSEAAKTQEDAAKDNSNAGKTFLKASDTMFLAGTAMMAFQGKWKEAAFLFLGQLATTLITYASTGGQSGGGILGAIVGAVTASANGNVMTQYGPVRLAKYSNGGVATSPQVSVFGEGSKNEAYVPLPDNRTIPVTLTGAQGSNVSIGDTTINVTVESNGNTQTTIDGNAQMAKMLGLAIKKTVHEEMMNQARPGGMLYGR